MSYTLITANRNYSSWSLRPWLLMRALGIPSPDRSSVRQAGQLRDFRAFLADRPGAAADRCGGGCGIRSASRCTRRPPPGVARTTRSARVRAAIVAEMHGGFGALRNDCTMNVGVRVAPRPMSQALQRNIARVREIFEEGLSRFGGPWLAGAAFTAADAFYAPVAFRIRTYGLDVGRGGEWVERVIAHPAMQDWERQALAETWREASHEDELAAAGTVTADYRQG
jgi:glutathione S-transferase